MTRLNERQTRLLATVRETNEQIQPTLDKLNLEYEIASYKAKAPVREAIEAAIEDGVPFSRVMREGMGFTYPGKLKEWMQMPESMAKHIMNQDLVEATATEFDSTVADAAVVTRDDTTGVFSVVYRGEKHEVKSYGSDGDFWSSADASIPQAVYDLIREEFPSWVLLEDED